MKPQPHRLSTDWLKDLKTDEAKEKRTKTIYNHTTDEVLVVLNSIVHKKLQEKLTSTFDYNTPSWSHYQAHTNGNIETLKWIADLLSFVKDR